MNCLKWISLVLIISSLVWAQEENSDFQDFQRQQNQDFNDFNENKSKEFSEFLQAESLACEQFRNEIELLWGNFIESTPEKWVEYSPDKKERSNVDFKSGEVTVELLLPRAEVEKNPGMTRDHLKKAVEKVILNKGKTRDFDVAGEKPKVLSETPLLYQQIILKNGQMLNDHNLPDFVEETVESHRISKEKVKGENEQDLLIVSLEFSLVPDHLRIRAQQYQQDVSKWSRHFNLNPDMVWAIIHTESYFNPKAKSKAPAYGLMQLVPHSGGRQALRYARNEDRIPSSRELYKSSFNIELGCAYLAYLQNEVYKNVKDPEVRDYLIISAYNTGPGNVSKTICGKNDTVESSRIVNSMNKNRVRKKLLSDLPYKETRNYLKIVLERMQMYASWSNRLLD